MVPILAHLGVGEGHFFERTLPPERQIRSILWGGLNPPLAPILIHDMASLGSSFVRQLSRLNFTLALPPHTHPCGW